MQHLLTGLPTILWASEKAHLHAAGNDPSQTQSRPALRWASREPSNRTLNKTPLPPQPPLQRGTLHSSPTGLLTRHTFSSQGLHTYYSAGMFSPWHLTSTRPQFHTGLQLNIILSQGPFLIIQFKSAFTSLYILLPCLIFLHCSHKYLIYYMSHWGESKFHETRISVSFTALLSSTRNVPYTW